MFDLTNHQDSSFSANKKKTHKLRAISSTTILKHMLPTNEIA